MRTPLLALLACAVVAFSTVPAPAATITMIQPCPARWWVSVSARHKERALAALHTELARISTTIVRHRDDVLTVNDGNYYPLLEPRGLIVGLKVDYNDRGIMVWPRLSKTCEATEEMKARGRDFISESEQEAVRVEMDAFVKHWKSLESLSRLTFRLRYR